MQKQLVKLRRVAGALAQKFPFLKNHYVRNALLGVGLIAIVVVAGFGYSYATSPANIRSPKFEHAHYRMQILVDGKPVNFAEQKFQEGYSKDNCNAEITPTPIHFHDNVDQMVHIHWEDITGGQVLKYYGWNYIGGVDGMLGFKFDKFPNLVAVPVHGQLLPKVPDDAKFYVYSGDEHGYKQREFKDFTSQDLEQFFGVHSNVEHESASLLNKLFPKAFAHGSANHEITTTSDNLSQEELKRINNLLGNVVIFVQRNEPTDQQIKERFAKLEPLGPSVCGG